jgi:hypothetical protein
LLSDDPPPTWGRLEIIDAALDYVRAEPCNHPDASTVRAKLTTVGQAPELGRGGDAQGNDPSRERSVWLVELRGDIQVLGIRGDPNSCDPSSAYTRAFYFVDLNGKVTSASGGEYDWDSR